MAANKVNLGKDTIISLVVLTYNDSDIVLSRLLKIKKELVKTKVNFEILVVDNASKDKTVREILSLKSLRQVTRILVLSKTYDAEVALTAGLDSCIGDITILFSLYVDPVNVIPQLITRLAEGANIVVGQTDEPMVKVSRLSQTLLNLSQRLSSTDWIYRSNYSLALDRKAVNAIIRTRRKSRNFSYINSLIGLTRATLKYKPLSRFQNRIKKENFLSLSKTILDTVISNSFKPLRALSLLGMLFSILYLFYVTVIVILYFFFNQKQLIPKGWVTVSTVLGTMFFILFSTLALLAEYVIRILAETRQEPFYFVSEEINKSTILPKPKQLNIV